MCRVFLGILCCAADDTCFRVVMPLAISRKYQLLCYGSKIIASCKYDWGQIFVLDFVEDVGCED
jgi:hypothetical protein